MSSKLVEIGRLCTVPDREALKQKTFEPGSLAPAELQQVAHAYA